MVIDDDDDADADDEAEQGHKADDSFDIASLRDDSDVCN